MLSPVLAKFDDVVFAAFDLDGRFLKDDKTPDANNRSIEQDRDSCET
jgi:hypothetical protein